MYVEGSVVQFFKIVSSYDFMADYVTVFLPSIYIPAIMYYNFKDVAPIINERGQFKKYLPVFCYMLLYSAISKRVLTRKIYKTYWWNPRKIASHEMCCAEELLHCYGF